VSFPHASARTTQPLLAGPPIAPCARAPTEVGRRATASFPSIPSPQSKREPAYIRPPCSFITCAAPRASQRTAPVPLLPSTPSSTSCLQPRPPNRLNTVTFTCGNCPVTPCRARTLAASIQTRRHAPMPTPPTNSLFLALPRP
jgi:hypothetical protein